MIIIYRLLTFLCLPFIFLIFLYRLTMNKEDRIRISERLGKARHARPVGPIIWIHCASVGESLSTLALVNKIIADYKNIHILITTGTITAAKILSKKIPKRTIHQYVPIDLTIAVKQFLKFWKPDLALWIESELWPKLVTETQKTQAPMILLNGRVSEKSYRIWKIFPSFIKKLLSSFDICLGQSNVEEEKLKSLGAKNVAYMGNLKFGAKKLSLDEGEYQTLKKNLKNRTVWLAASTHPHEEKIIGSIHLKLKSYFENLLTVIVPRHPSRGNAIGKILKGNGLNISQRSKHDTIERETEIYLADTIGELALFYKLSDVVFLGGSLKEHAGGHNPLEPSHFLCALVVGPGIKNFNEVFQEFFTSNAAIQIKNGEDLFRNILDLLKNKKKRENIAMRANKIAKGKSKILEDIYLLLKPFLNRTSLQKDEEIANT